MTDKPKRKLSGCLADKEAMQAAARARSRTFRYKHVKGQITPRQEQFCQLVAQGLYSNTECARQVGYTPKSAANAACKLLKRPQIQKRIGEITERAGHRNDVTIDEVIKKLRDAYDEAMANGQTGAAVSAAARLGSYLGMFSEKINVKAQGSIFTREGGDDFERLSKLAAMHHTRKEGAGS